MRRAGGIGFLFEQLALDWIETENFANAREAAAMYWRSAKFFQETAMFGSWIAFVGREVVAGIRGIKFNH